MRTYYRLQPEDDDPERLLDPENQHTEPWGGTVYGRCDKCGGSGKTTFECESCLEHRDSACPVCHGEVKYEGECPACEGSGEVDDSARDGVSVFPEVDGLYRYMIRRDADFEDSVLVSLEGEETGDDDFDADEGALLVKPTRILGTDQVNRDQVEKLRDELARESAT